MDNRTLDKQDREGADIQTVAKVLDLQLFEGINCWVGKTEVDLTMDNKIEKLEAKYLPH